MLSMLYSDRISYILVVLEKEVFSSTGNKLVVDNVNIGISFHFLCNVFSFSRFHNEQQ